MPVVERNGHLYLRYILGRDVVTGKRIERFHRAKSDNRRQAERELRDILAARDRGEPIDASRMTLAEFLPRWLEHIQSTGRLSPRTIAIYSEVVDRRLIPDLGRAELRKLSPLALSEYYARLMRSGRQRGQGELSPRTVRQVHAVLSAALKLARLWGLIATSPAEGVPVPAGPQYHAKLPTREQVELLMESIKARPLYLAVLIGAATGLREGAIAGLRWGDVDLEAGRLLSRCAAVSVDGEIIIRGTKTGRIQLISIPAYAVALLADYRKQHPGLQDSDFVLSGKPKPYSPKLLSARWRYYADRCGMQGVRFHDLRHWQATLLYQSGMDLKAISERLGHSRISTTADIYTHLLLSTEEESARRIDAILGPRMANSGCESIPESIQGGSEGSS